MYEEDNTAVATSRRSTCKVAETRPAQWANAERPLGTVRALDGQRLENSSESPPGKRKCESCAKDDMERIRAPWHGNTEHEKDTCQEERLAPLGNTAHDRRDSLHSEKKTQLVSVHKPSGLVNTENVLQLLEYQQYRCALTGRQLTPQTAALDHIVPIRLDGEHMIENTQVLHKDVNRAKGSLTNDEFLNMCQEIVRWSRLSTSGKDHK